MTATVEPDRLEMQLIRQWWAEMPADQQRACLHRRAPESCPCGNGTARGHVHGWCSPHPAWLPDSAFTIAALRERQRRISDELAEVNRKLNALGANDGT